MKKAKKPLLQKKWVWVLISLAILAAIGEVKSIFGETEKTTSIEHSTKKTDNTLDGLVEVPDPYFKEKTDVETEYNAKGLNVKFFVSNFDKKAKINNRYLKKDECDQLKTQRAVKYYDSEKVGEKSGFYAKKGATIKIGFTDHDFDGTKEVENTKTKEKASKETKITSESSDKKVSESEPLSSETPTSNSNKNIEELSLNSNENIKQFIEQKSPDITIIEVNGIYAIDGEYTTVITLDSGSNSINSAKNDILSVLKALKDSDLSNFKEINISVKGDLTDGSKGYIIKSSFSTGPIKKGSIIYPTKIQEKANSWWQIQN